MTCEIPKTVLLSGVVFQEGGVWVARCFTIDYAAEGQTPSKAIKECVKGVVADTLYAIKHNSVEYLEPMPVAEQFKYLAATIGAHHCPDMKMPVACSKVGGKNRIKEQRGVASFSEMLATAVA